jgi:hypothetical protein
LRCLKTVAAKKRRRRQFSTPYHFRPGERVSSNSGKATPQRSISPKTRAGHQAQINPCAFFVPRL